MGALWEVCQHLLSIPARLGSGVLKGGLQGRLKQIREAGPCGAKYKANSQQRHPPAAGVLPSSYGLGELQLCARSWPG